jgi:Na+/H+ antiporter NhaC
MEWWQIYLFTRIDAIYNLFIIMIIMSTVISILTITIHLSADPDSWHNEEYKNWSLLWKNRTKKPSKIFPWITLGIIIITILLPTQKEVAIIYLLPKIINSSNTLEMQHFPIDVIKIIQLQFDVWIKDLEPEPLVNKK